LETQPKELEKEEQIKFKATRKEIIKIRLEISEIENTKEIENINKNQN
jgi:hypothetical protein